DETGEWCARRVHPHERRPDQTELPFFEMKFRLQDREHGKDGLPVRVVEEADQPEHADDRPFIRRRWVQRQSPCFRDQSRRTKRARPTAARMAATAAPAPA